MRCYLGLLGEVGYMVAFAGVHREILQVLNKGQPITAQYFW